jgi:AGCS family alanine or glycine:cation symporter
VITDSLASNWNLDRLFVIIGLLGLLFYGVIGGIERIGKICSFIMPIFMATYVLMSLWIIFQEFSSLPSVFLTVFKSAFTGHAAVGGFAGSSCALAIQHGIARAAYSADIGIGFDSIIQSESSAVQPEKQAYLGMFGVCLDNLICTMSILVVLVSGVWKALDPIDASLLVQTALSTYFPYMDFFMPFFLFILGYTTLIAYFGVGVKCAQFLHPYYGIKLYFLYALGAFVFFSFFDQSHALLIMSLSGGALLVTNLLGIFSLRQHITFHVPEGKVSKKASAIKMQCK